MMRHGDGKINRKYFIWFLVIWVVQMAAAFYFCTQKQGFHEDEYYTYYATARTNGFYVEDGRWMERDTYRNEFVVLPGQGFQYGLVKLVQSWDVHPPMYYWVFHTAASLVPGVFSKWIGLSVNLFFHGINIILLTYMSYLAGRRDCRLALFVTLFFGCSPAAVSGVVFIRMYEMLTTFVLLCGILHVRAVEAEEERLSVLRCLLPMAAVTYAGFLTQYYYFIFLFFIACGFGLWLLWRDRSLHNCIRYGVSQGVALGLAYATYPSCLGQMFRGQRGAQATENFFDLSNTIERIRFFWELLDTYVFGKLLPVFLLLVIVLWVTARRRRTDGAEAEWGAAYGLLLFTALGYFLTVSKTALLLGDTSNRYQLPIYGIVVFLVFRAVQVLWERIFAGAASGRKGMPVWNAQGRIYTALAAVLCVAVGAAGLLSGKVVFLYPESEAQVSYAVERVKENEDIPVVYLYRPGEEWCVWDVADELFVYPRVYFASAKEGEAIGDEKIRSAKSLVVYVAKGDDEEALLAGALGSGGKAGTYEKVFEEKYCSVYYCHE